jgi:hypothetical protein
VEEAKVKKLFRDSEGSAGARSIARMATDQDVPLSRYRASKLMEKLGLVLRDPHFFHLSSPAAIAFSPPSAKARSRTLQSYPFRPISSLPKKK